MLSSCNLGRLCLEVLLDFNFLAESSSADLRHKLALGYQSFLPPITWYESGCFIRWEENQHEWNFMYTTSIYILPKILSSSILVSFCKPCIIASRYGNSSREASLSMSSLDIKYADKSCCGLKLHWISGSVFVLFMHRFGNSFFEISSTESIAPITMTHYLQVMFGLITLANFIHEQHC